MADPGGVRPVWAAHARLRGGGEGRPGVRGVREAHRQHTRHLENTRQNHSLLVSFATENT